MRLNFVICCLTCVDLGAGYACCTLMYLILISMPLPFHQTLSFMFPIASESDFRSGLRVRIQNQCNAVRRTDWQRQEKNRDKRPSHRLKVKVSRTSQHADGEDLSHRICDRRRRSITRHAEKRTHHLLPRHGHCPLNPTSYKYPS